MAHTYVITSVTQSGDLLVISGSVDGITVNVTAYASAAGNALASALGFRNFIAPIMLAALPVSPTALGALNQTFTQ